MSKKRWFIVPVVAGLLALAVTGGAIFAQSNSGGPGGPGREGIITRVSEILGLEESTVQDAFSQAHQEQQDANLQRKLDQMVANEKLTQAEADAISEWYQAKPAVDLPLRGFMHSSEEGVQQLLDQMVADERLTQAEADAVMVWYQDKPAALSELSSGHKRFYRGSQGRFDGESQGRGFRQGPNRGGNGANTDTRFDGASRSFNPQITAQSISY